MRSSGGLETAVALKVLRADLQDAHDALQRLRDEARALGHLDHPAIVRAFDILELEGRVALVTELVEGDDLDRCIEGSDRISTRALLQVVAQVADALDAAVNAPGPHGPLKLVHRDVKPSNIRIGRHGQVKLLDFGIAWFAGSDREAQTASEMMVGSLPYMAPERFTERDQNPASDVFSLGCCLYEGLGVEGFYEETRLRTLSGLAMAPERFDALKERRLSLIEPPEVRAFLADMLHHDPSRRPTAKQVARRCDEIADDLSGTSLRLWCSDRTWRDNVDATGSLTGQTLAEGPVAPQSASSERAAPRIVTEPSSTIDPSMDVFATDAGALQGESLPNPPNPNRPVAPPAFPSIPVGMAIKQDLISQAQVDTVLEGVTPPFQKPGGKADEAPQRLSAPLPAQPEKKGSNTLIIAVAVGLIAMMLAAGFLFFLVALLGIVATMM